MKTIRPFHPATALAAMGLLLLLTGCDTVSSRSHPYLAVPSYPRTKPQQVQLVPAEPAVPHERLGEVFVGVTGEPSKERIEKAIRTKAATFGADAAFIVYDRTHIFPVVYIDWWGATVSHERQRDIVAVAIRYKNEQDARPGTAPK